MSGTHLKGTHEVVTKGVDPTTVLKTISAAENYFSGG